MMEYENKNCLVMFSGGKDSALCLALLNDFGLNVRAIHFTHSWGWNITTQEAIRIARILGVDIEIYDISEDFLNEIAGKIRGRPCTVCKTIMDRKSIQYCIENNFGFIVQGDNSKDGSLERIRRYEETRGQKDSDLFITQYLDCVELGFILPENIRVVRPLVNMDPEKIEQMLSDIYGIKVQKVHETGDKYKYYWREGCPLQYTDSDALLTPELMEELIMLNSLVTSYARNFGIRASIFLPSRKIVTVPEGHEKEVLLYLKDNGYL